MRDADQDDDLEARAAAARARLVTVDTDAIDLDDIGLFERICREDELVGFDIETTMDRLYEQEPCLLQIYGSSGRESAIYCYQRREMIERGFAAIAARRPEEGQITPAFFAPFEQAHAQKQGFYPKLACTYIAAKVLYGVIKGDDSDDGADSESWSLAAVAERVLGITVPKAYQVSDWRIRPEGNSEALTYGILDARLPLYLWTLFKSQFDEQPYQYDGWKIINDAVPAIAAANLAGLHFDKEAHAKLCARLEENTAAHVVRLNVGSFDLVRNHSSSKQVSEFIVGLLYPFAVDAEHASNLFLTHTGVRWPVSAGNYLSFDKGRMGSIIKTWRASRPSRRRRACRTPATAGSRSGICETGSPTRRTTNYTRLSARRWRSSLDPDGRIRATYLPARAKTTRTSAVKPNTQQMPGDPEFRVIFDTVDGRVYVIADFGQIELRVGAIICDDKPMQKVFSDGRDIHSATFELINEVTYDEDNPAHRKGRKNGKSVTFGCIAQGQPVLTDRGLVPIEDVRLADRVWDGVEWVTHAGVVFQGRKPVITRFGLTATPDHEVFTNAGTKVRLDQLEVGTSGRCGRARRRGSRRG